MLSMGASKPWPDALEAFNGERIMSGKAIELEKKSIQFIQISKPK